VTFNDLFTDLHTRRLISLLFTAWSGISFSSGGSTLWPEGGTGSQPAPQILPSPKIFSE